MNTMAGRWRGRRTAARRGRSYFRLDEPGPTAQGDFDLEIEVPRMVYESSTSRASATGSSPCIEDRFTCFRRDAARARGPGGPRGARRPHRARRARARVPPGEVLALIGPNGAGKSTLLRSSAARIPRGGRGALPRHRRRSARRRCGPAAHGERLPGSAPRRHDGPETWPWAFAFAASAARARRAGWGVARALRHRASRRAPGADAIGR